jgi:hypothetical protein
MTAVDTIHSGTIRKFSSLFSVDSNRVREADENQASRQRKA